MNKEKELELVNKYPKILKNYGGDMRETCMFWGFEFDDGWFDLIEKCLGKLQYYCDAVSKDGREVQVVADQLKEKYGTLRFYYSAYGSNKTDQSIISDIVHSAEFDSEHKCEISGKDGTICKKFGWYKTLCYEEARKNGFVACNEETEKYWKSKDEHSKICDKTQTDEEVGETS